MAEALTLAQLRAAIADTKLWDFSVHLRRLLQQDAAAIENVDNIEEVRQTFENLLAALKTVVALKKKKFLTVEATPHLQEIHQFAIWHLEQARSLLDKNGVEISKISRDLAPEKPAISSAPATPRPPSTPLKFDPLTTPLSPFKRILPPEKECSCYSPRSPGFHPTNGLCLQNLVDIFHEKEEKRRRGKGEERGVGENQ